MYEDIKYIVIDVDGTMTDGGVYYDDNGNEVKKFCTKDAVGYFAAKKAGIKLILLTGRECPATTKRITEMKFEYMFQGIKNKYSFLKMFINEHNINRNEIAYIGDDLNDYKSIQLCSFLGCPEDACTEIIEIADYHSTIKGGYGAVRDIISYILKQRNQWETVIADLFD